MKKIFIAALLLLSLSSFANTRVEDLEGQTVEGSANIYNLLASPVDGFENPNCLALHVRRGSNLDLRYAVGQYVSSLSFTRKIVIQSGVASEVLKVVMGFKIPNGENAPGTYDFQCWIKN